MKYKKSQIRMMETISILLIFFVLIVLAFTFYLKTSTFTQDEKVTKDQELQSIRVSQTVSFLPELQCSSKNIISENCFDRYKLDIINNSNFDDTYYPLFYYSRITINETYPGSSSWKLYERTRDSTSYKTTMPVLIYNPIERINSFGLLNVEYFTID